MALKKLTESEMKSYLKEKRNSKQPIKISRELFDLMVKLVFKKNKDYRICYVKSQDTFCTLSGLKAIADENAEAIAESGTESGYVIPASQDLLVDLCNEGLIFSCDSILKKTEIDEAEKEFESKQAEQAEQNKS